MSEEKKTELMKHIYGLIEKGLYDKVDVFTGYLMGHFENKEKSLFAVPDYGPVIVGLIGKDRIGIQDLLHNNERTLATTNEGEGLFLYAMTDLADVNEEDKEYLIGNEIL